MGGQRAALFISPSFLGVLSLKSAEQNIFNARIAAAGEAFVDESLDVRRDVRLHGGFSLFSLPFYYMA
jgi:hypothetical protein